MVSNLDIAAAKYTLGMIRSGDLPSIADAALDRGQYSDSLAELALIRDPIMSEVGPLFEATMAELNLSFPSETQAIHMVLVHYIQPIVDGTVAPYDGLHKLIQDVYHGTNLFEKSEDFAGDSHGIQHLVGAYYDYDDLRDRPHEVSFENLFGNDAVDALDAHVIQLSREWLKVNAA